MELHNLADKPEFLETIVDWLYEELGIKGKANNRNYWASWVRSSLSKTDIPQTYITLCDNEIVATFSLWRCDLQSRQDIYPWFGGLYVNKLHRSRGYGKLMQIEALKILHDLGYHEVHLFTKLEYYFEQMNWSFIQEVPDETGMMVRLYRRSTSRSPQNEEVRGP